jgi:peroxiredoxin
LKSLNRRILTALFAAFYFSIFPLHEPLADGKAQTTGVSLPKASFQDAVSGDTMKYLGLPRQKNFSLNDIRGPIIVIELFSTYCTSCPRNVPILNDLYAAVEKDTQLKGRVNIVGIAIGNTGKEVESYKKTYDVLFPVLTDYDFRVHDALGNPRVPYTFFVKKSPKGKAVVESHQGVLESSEFALKKVRSLK